MKDLSNNIIQSIGERAVKPVPHWQYVARKILFWALAVTGVLTGALALALAIYTIQTIDWNMYSVLGYGSLHAFVMDAFPYTFILILIALLALAYFFYRHTPKGHKINISILVGIIIAFALSLAFLSHILGLNQGAYFQLARTPYMHQMMFTKESEWSQPDKGLLWGEVLNVGNNSFSLRDANGKNWNVSYDKNTAFDANIDSNQGENVKIVGQKTSDNNFQAKEIQRWDGVMNCNGHRNMMMNGGGMMRSGGMMGGGRMMNKY